MKDDIVGRINTLFDDNENPPTPGQVWAEVGEAILDEIKRGGLQVTIPTGTFLTAAQAGVPNAAPVTVQGIPASEGGIAANIGGMT